MIAAVLHVGLLDAGFGHFRQVIDHLRSNVFTNGHDAIGQLRTLSQQSPQVGFPILKVLPSGELL
jgi:hypothetical protein